MREASILFTLTPLIDRESFMFHGLRKEKKIQMKSNKLFMEIFVVINSVKTLEVNLKISYECGTSIHVFKPTPILPRFIDI